MRLACEGGGTHEEGYELQCIYPLTKRGIHCVREGYTLHAEGVVLTKRGIHCVRRGWYSQRGVYIACGGGGTHEERVYIACERGYTLHAKGVVFTKRGYTLRYGGGGTHEEGVCIACGGGVYTWYNYYCP